MELGEVEFYIVVGSKVRGREREREMKIEDAFFECIHN